MKLREIPISEVAKHKGKKSNWIIIHNNVYDVTAFLTEHPGGEEALMNYAGKDGTGAFEDVGHSPDARELLTKFQIGYLPLQERNTFIDPCEGGGFKWWYLLPLLIILGGAFAARKKFMAG